MPQIKESRHKIKHHALHSKVSTATFVARGIFCSVLVGLSLIVHVLSFDKGNTLLFATNQQQNVKKYLSIHCSTE
jgi:formate/nitrite transporter FocA (FNT family)